MAVLEGLSPYNVFHYFEEICAIPHGSGNERSLSDYICGFARARGLEYYQDSAYNVIIKKPASKGREGSAGVILQCHIDMVCEKNKGTSHNFLTQGIELVRDGDFIRANGTTLGADNGIAAAYMLAILSDGNIVHPPLECLFTTDEEAGMRGALALDASQIKGRRLINIDTEEEGHLLVSCCGGMRVNARIPVSRVDSDEGLPCLLGVKGLLGGHSGSDIHLFRANSNKVIARALLQLSKSFSYKLCSLTGGLMDNAIPREAEAEILIRAKDMDGMKAQLLTLTEILKKEFPSEVSLELTLEPSQKSAYRPMNNDSARRAVALVSLAPYGVIRMSQHMEGLVETSNNPGILQTEEDAVILSGALRSSSETMKAQIFDEINTLASMLGGSACAASEYPSWAYNPESRLLEDFKTLYRDMYNREAVVTAIHAGLECGLFSRKIPGIDMISIGPNIYNAHTPDERVSISSTQRVWEFLIKALEYLK